MRNHLELARVWLPLALVLMAAACASSQTTAAPATLTATTAVSPAPDEYDVLGRGIDAYVSSFGRSWGDAYAFNGYVAVARDGKVVFGKGYGKADREKSVVPDADTVFRIASVSKPFTAIGILQLQEKGLLNVDDPIRKYVPELPAMADGVTILHCLTHASGLPPLPGDVTLAAETGAAHPLAAFAGYKDQKLASRPGERFEYTNAGFIVLAAILERVSGQSFEAYMQEHVFRPAGMLHTTTVSTPPPPNMAVPYDVDERDVMSASPPLPGDFILFGCGAVRSTANDLVAFGRALGGTTLLSESSKLQMVAPVRDDVGGAAPRPSQMALGWFVQKEAGHELLWHGGSFRPPYGFKADLVRIPDTKTTVVVLSNAASEAVMAAVAQGVLDSALTGKAPAPHDEPAVGRAVDDAELAAIAGNYRMDEPTRAATIARYGSRLPDGWPGLSLTAKEGRLFVGWIGLPGGAVEVFRGVDGSLFTKRLGLRISTEQAGEAHAGAVVVVPPDGGFSAPRRYVSLASTLTTTPGLASCPPDMVRLPGGSLAGEQNVSIAPLCMDRTEVTVAAYEACVRSGACVPAPSTARWKGIEDADRARWSPACNAARKDRQDHPVNCVDWAQSAAYCRARGKRLPTAEEWEWAARGGDQERLYPWGYGPPGAQLCWSGSGRKGGTCPVGSFPEGDALGGLHDIAGNVWEWTSSATDAKERVMMGGAWVVTDAANVGAGSRLATDPGFRGPNAGFRCVR